MTGRLGARKDNLSVSQILPKGEEEKGGWEGGGRGEGRVEGGEGGEQESRQAAPTFRARLSS